MIMSVFQLMMTRCQVMVTMCNPWLVRSNHQRSGRKGEGAPTCMNLYLSCSASAKSHLRLHLSRLPPLPAGSHTHHILQVFCTHVFSVSCNLVLVPVTSQALIVSLMQRQLSPCFMMHTYTFSLMQPHVAPCFMVPLVSWCPLIHGAPCFMVP